MEVHEPGNVKNRGKSSEDDTLFSPPKEFIKLSQALEDMYYLLSRGYAVKSSLVLTGNRYRLQTRQLMALQGMGCSAQEIETRKDKEVKAEALKEKILYLDGFNVLILLETVLSGGYIFRGLDGCYRDISSVHGTYKKVSQTDRALVLVGNALQKLGLEKAVWIFDTPVSNSGRLKALCYKIATENKFNWEVLLENNPDKYLTQNGRLAASADAWVLNECAAWFNLGSHIINELYTDIERPPHIIEIDL